LNIKKRLRKPRKTALIGEISSFDIFALRGLQNSKHSSYHMIDKGCFRKKM